MEERFEILLSETCLQKRESLFIVHIPFKVANRFVSLYHRHNKPLIVARFSLGVVDEAGKLRGVAIIANPVARMLDDGWSLEVRRVATDGCKNACSALYGAARRVTFELGYRRLLTYTLQEESGSSLRGAGWIQVAEVLPSKGKTWQNRPGREHQAVCDLPKYRWEAIHPKCKQKAWTFAGISYPWETGNGE